MLGTTLAPLVLATCLGAAPYTHDVDVAEEFRSRDGLPNLFAKLQAGGSVRLAYLGGSITAANGWRPKTLAWVQAQSPQARVAQINAAISGTGSDYGACRVQGDVLAHPVYGDDRGRTDAMLRGAVKCSRAGETLTVKWNGTTVGMSDIPHGEPATVEAVVDGGPPVNVKRVQTEKARKHARFWYLPELPAGEHTVTFTVKELPAGSWLYAGQFLIVGTPVP
jgi:hypothetical protein